LGNAAIAGMDIPDEVTNKIFESVLTMDSAKQNPLLKKHFTTTALNGLDTKISELMEELEFGDTDKAEITAIKNSYERAAALTKKVKDLESKRFSGTKGDKDKLAQQITELNAQIATIKGTQEKAISELNNKHLQDRINWQVDSIYEGFDYANPYSGAPVTPEQKKLAVLTAKTLVNEALKNKAVSLTSDENGKLSLRTSEGTDYFENNLPVDVTGFVKKTLLNAKAIKVTDASQSNGKGKAPATVQRPTGATASESANPKMVSKMESLAAEAEADLGNGAQ
jgi:hypothetical protein